MTAWKDVATFRDGLWWIDPGRIEVERNYNVRGFDSANDKADRRLKQEIRRDGVRNPLVLRLDGGRVKLVAGHRRLGSVTELRNEGVEIREVPFVPEPPGVNEEDRAFDLIRSNDMGKPLTALQRAQVMQRLRGYGWKPKDIAERIGCSVKHVTDMLDLIRSPFALRCYVENGQIAPTSAVQLFRQHGDDAAEVAHKLVAEAEAAGRKKIKPAPKLSGLDALRLQEVKAEADRFRRDYDAAVERLQEIARLGDAEGAVARRLAREALGWEVRDAAE